MKKKIAIPAGYWSTNIGNSFFQLGAEYVLQTVFPEHEVILIGDQPGYWRPGKKGNPSHAIVLTEFLEIDYLVILGPFLRPEYDEIWLPTLKKLHEKGVRLILLAAGMMDYSQEQIQRYRDWLSKIPPFILVTRDSVTYKAMHDLAEHSYDGIDVAFFISDYYTPPQMQIEPFVTFNFDKWPEPTILPETGNESEYDFTFRFEGKTWTLSFPRLRTNFVQGSRFFQFLSTWMPENQSVSFGTYPIIRTDHRFNPLLIRNIFKKNRLVAMDIPQPYLTIYANTKLTLSNRVHACVATLAYGNAAMLFSRSPRAALLDRAGLQNIGKQPVKMDMEFLQKEKSQLISFLKSIDL